MAKLDAGPVAGAIRLCDEARTTGELVLGQAEEEVGLVLRAARDRACEIGARTVIANTANSIRPRT